MNQYITSFAFQAEDDDKAKAYMEAITAVVAKVQEESHPSIEDLRASYLKMDDKEEVDDAAE